jgi:hypothetical protein
MALGSVPDDAGQARRHDDLLQLLVFKEASQLGAKPPSLEHRDVVTALDQEGAGTIRQLKQAGQGGDHGVELGSRRAGKAADRRAGAVHCLGNGHDQPQFRKPPEDERVGDELDRHLAAIG